MRPSSIAASLVIALALLAATPRAAVADHGVDYATGRLPGFFFGQLSVDFSARSSNTGTDARGHVRITEKYQDPDRTYSGEVTCLRVTRATATTPATAVISAKITDQPPGSPWQSVLMFATDSGKFANAPDTFDFRLMVTPSLLDGTCPATVPFGALLVEQGEIVIHNTLP